MLDTTDGENFLDWLLNFEQMNSDKHQKHIFVQEFLPGKNPECSLDRNRDNRIQVSKQARKRKERHKNSLKHFETHFHLWCVICHHYKIYKCLVFSKNRVHLCNLSEILQQTHFKLLGNLSLKFHLTLPLSTIATSKQWKVVLASYNCILHIFLVLAQKYKQQTFCRLSHYPFHFQHALSIFTKVEISVS